jgi:hypothetical protein
MIDAIVSAGPDTARCDSWTRAVTVRGVAIPDFQTLMRPLLVAVQDGEEHTIQNVRDRLVREFALTDEDLADGPGDRSIGSPIEDERCSERTQRGST